MFLTHRGKCSIFFALYYLYIVAGIIIPKMSSERCPFRLKSVANGNCVHRAIYFTDIDFPM